MNEMAEHDGSLVVSGRGRWEMRGAAVIDGRTLGAAGLLLSVVLAVSGCRDHGASSSRNTAIASGDTAVQRVAMGPAPHAATPPARPVSAARVAPAPAAAATTAAPSAPAVAHTDSVVTASTSTAPPAAATPT